MAIYGDNSFAVVGVDGGRVFSTLGVDLDSAIAAVMGYSAMGLQVGIGSSRAAALAAAIGAPIDFTVLATAFEFPTTFDLQAAKMEALELTPEQQAAKDIEFFSTIPTVEEELGIPSVTITETLQPAPAQTDPSFLSTIIGFIGNLGYAGNGLIGSSLSGLGPGQASMHGPQGGFNSQDPNAPRGFFDQEPHIDDEGDTGTGPPGDSGIGVAAAADAAAGGSGAASGGVTV